MNKKHKIHEPDCGLFMCCGHCVDRLHGSVEHAGRHTDRCVGVGHSVTVLSVVLAVLTDVLAVVVTVLADVLAELADMLTVLTDVLHVLAELTVLAVLVVFTERGT